MGRLPDLGRVCLNDGEAGLRGTDADDADIDIPKPPELVDLGEEEPEVNKVSLVGPVFRFSGLDLVRACGSELKSVDSEDDELDELDRE